MREVAVVSFAEMQPVAAERARDEIEMLLPVITEAIERSGIPRREIGFTVSGSCDFLVGRPFSFVMALDAAGAWPPIPESHVEMDGAWALYEAWVRLQHGDVDSALIYAFGRPSLGDLDDVLTMQLDPYYVSPLRPGAAALAALQARALVESGRGGSAFVPDRVPSYDGAAAVVLAAGELARRVAARPAWIRGIDHRIEPHSLGARDLTRSRSTEIAAATARVSAARVDAAELHAVHEHERIILRDALGLGPDVPIHPPDGAPLPMMVAGLSRIGAAARRIHEGTAHRVVAHATSGPCLQQNLVCVLEAGA